MSDERLKAAYRAQFARAEPGEAHWLPVERLLDLVEGRGSEEERLATLAVVSRTPALLEELELLRAAAEGAGGSAAAPAVGALTWSRRVGMAAAIVLTVGLGSLWLRRPGFDAPARGEDASVLLVAPAERASDPSPVFTWRAVAGSTAYRLEVMTTAGDLLFDLTTADTTAATPAGVLLEQGVEYRWWVTAVLPGGVDVRAPARPLSVSR